jgi:hypothetical protein
LPVRQFDQRVGLTWAFAEALDDPRDPDLTEHSFLEMVRSRVYGILAEYEGQNDHDTLRHDPVFKLLADRSPEDDDLASQPTLSRFENAISIKSLKRLRDVFIDQFIASFDTPPRHLTFDLALMYQAFEEPDEQRRVQLAKDALAICPDCADAYVLLAEHATSRQEALRLYEQGVAAGERALGAEAFQRDVGYYWGILETRPYMRARLRLAHSLWTAGRRDEAVRHLQDLLRPNPGDNQACATPWRASCCSSTGTTTWTCCFNSTANPRQRGPTPRPCSPSAGTATPPKSASCLTGPRKRTGTSRPTSWASWPGRRRSPGCAWRGLSLSRRTPAATPRRSAPRK